MKLRALSLKYKFIITIGVFTLLLSVTMGYIVTDRLSQQLWKDFFERGSGLSSSMADLVNKVADKDSNPTKLILETQTVTQMLAFSEEYLFQGEFVYFQIYYNGLNFIQNPRNIDEAFFLKEPVDEPFEQREIILANNEKVWDFKRVLNCGTSLGESTLAEPEIQLCNEPSYVRVGLSPVEVTRELQQAVLLLSLVTAAFILIGILVAFVLYKLVLGPVDVLTLSVKQFRHDRFARANVHSGDELETLGDEFNKMANTISRHESRLERINDELYRANQVKSEFLAVMGHELKTPLHAIRGYSQLLLEGVDGPLTAEQIQDIKAILGSGNHLLELIDNILRFSKLESGEEPLHLERIDAADLFRQVLQHVESLVRNRDLKLIDETSPVVVEADETKLKQILINLVSNAIKYTPSGSITVRTYPMNGQTPPQVYFEVADTGPGIAPEDAERVFEPFTQLDGSTTRESSGIGLGLAIVKKYIEMHGGRVWFEPNASGGTTFFVSLPASPLPEAAEGKSTQAAVVSSHKEEHATR